MVSFSRQSKADLEKKWKKSFSSETPVISTLHAFGLFILKKYLKQKVSLIKPYEQQRIIKNLIEESVNPDDLKVEMFRVMNIISFYKSKNIEYDNIGKLPYPEELKTKMKEATTIKKVKAYFDYLSEQSLYDFDDLIYKSYRLLLENPTALAKVRKKYSTFIVDEAQDLNAMNWALIFLLCGGQRLIAVGDPCQNIYMFRYAEPDKFSVEEFEKHFEKVIDRHLPNNYRSTPDIVNFGNIIRDHCGNDLVAIPKVKDPEKKSIYFYRTKHSSSEGAQIVKVINAFLKIGYKLSDFVVISRSSNFLKTVVEKEVIKENMPYEIMAGNAVSFHESAGAMMYMAMISLMLNPSNMAALTSIVPFMHGMGGMTKQKSGYEKMGKNAALYTKLILTCRRAYVTSNNKKYDAAIGNYYDKVIDYRHKIKDVTALMLTLDELYSVHLQNTVESMQIKPALFARIRSIIMHSVNDYLEERPTASIKEALGDMLLNVEGYEPEKSKDRLTLATVHSQKGLESKITIACGFRSYSSFDDLGDEANILYVQMSRAIERLVIIRSDKFRVMKGSTIWGNENQHFNAVMHQQFPKEMKEIQKEEEYAKEKETEKGPPRAKGESKISGYLDESGPPMPEDD